MGDTIIISEDEKPAKPDEVIVVKPQPVPKKETVVTEKTTVTQTRVE